MRRREFGIMAGLCLAEAATRPALAQPVTPDPSLLKTKLTPLGAERAGNADGSIPAWTGGTVSPSLSPTRSVDVPMFLIEQPLYTVSAKNMAQYANLLTPGTQQLIRKFGLGLNVFQTHRTASAPQYVYGNTATNATRAKLNPAGGRLGFFGAYGGIPFPIPDTSDPHAAGAQLIWNHLLAWPGYSGYIKFVATFVVAGGKPVLTRGAMIRDVHPYYDPDGSLDTFDGYYGKEHVYSKAPAIVHGEQAITWVSTGANGRSDVTWALLNGMARVREVSDGTFDTPNPLTERINNYDDAYGFAGSPRRYDWKIIGKREMLIPYNNSALHYATAETFFRPAFPNPDLVRWEKHRVWVLEATLHPGERNTTARRLIYLDEDTWRIVLADGYDADNNLTKTTENYLRCIPSLPGTIYQGYSCWNFDVGKWTTSGAINYPPYDSGEYFGPQNAEYFNPKHMAAEAAF